MRNANEIGAYLKKKHADRTEKTVNNEKPSKNRVTVMTTAMPVEIFDFL